jgi:hypothetical protein
MTTKNGNADSGDDSDDEMEEILSDIQEVLSLAQRQGVLPPVRIARILAGEGTGQFSSSSNKTPQRTVPLSVALDYVGEILDESRSEISRLKVRPCICVLCIDILTAISRLSASPRLRSITVYATQWKHRWKNC